ncbi:MAG: Hsp20/alpha crystallin family protein [Pseudomonadales bacterium]|jgi:HSP20 family protein
MDTDRMKEDFGNTWKWLAEGWRNISAKAANALTYFSPTRSDEEVSDVRWGLMALDVSEHGDYFQVALEAPGLEKDEIDISVEDHRLIVTGTKRYENERKEGAMHVTERAFGSFQRVIPFPERVTAEGADASYKRGVLKVKIPKAVPPSAKKIQVSGT